MKQTNPTALCTFLTERYGIPNPSLSPAKRGFFGETWRLETPERPYFLKLDSWTHHKQLYRDSFPIMEFLTQCGLPFVPKIRKALDGALCTEFEEGVLGIFDFIEGENVEDYPLEHLFERLFQLYLCESKGLTLHTESFDTGVLDEFLRLKARALAEPFPSAAQLAQSFANRAQLFAHREARLRLFSARCAGNTEGFHLTHGDAGGNCIIQGTQFTIIDWDFPMLAPPERDAWFFLHHANLIASINAILGREPLGYQLRPDRMAYYCYFSFFHYIREYLLAYLAVDTPQEKQSYADAIEDYFSGWLEEQLGCAETLYS